MSSIVSRSQHPIAILLFLEEGILLSLALQDASPYKANLLVNHGSQFCNSSLLFNLRVSTVDRLCHSQLDEKHSAPVAKVQCARGQANPSSVLCAACEGGSQARLHPE